MHGDEERGVAALGQHLARSVPPQREMGLERQLHERVRPPGLLVQRRLEVQARHADVVLLGGQADLLPGLEPAEALVAPGPGELAGDPGVGRLTDYEDPLAVFTDEHWPLDE